MNKFVAHIKWDAVEIASGNREEGDLWCRLDDIVILPVQVKRGVSMVAARMAALDSTRRTDLLEIQRITEEVNALSEAEEIESTLYRKLIQLSPGYQIGYGDQAKPEGRVGFGLTGDIGLIEPAPTGCKLTFSWDWFNVQSQGKAAKLQESGKITFEEATTACGYEIVRMLFDSDVEIRIEKFENAMSLKPDWRIRIREGSEIRWPSLIDGVNVANGFVD